MSFFMPGDRAGRVPAAGARCEARGGLRTLQRLQKLQDVNCRFRKRGAAARRNRSYESTPYFFSLS